ncbi:MAG: haloacid dehalogenase, partial [Mycobacteriaceae bacterium]|nr:haloacid dehalogenase [Mycobacteriaceae bacterium]
DGLVETIVTADDVTKPLPSPEAYQLALLDLGIPAQNALAFSGSSAGLRTAHAVGLATVLIDPDRAAHDGSAAAVRADYADVDQLRIANCRRLHERWCETHRRSAA